MIPLKLSLRNFMCYRDNVPPLYFEGIHTACISGDNGNGKSALLDAITWALWGKARAKSDDDLIHLGEPEMEVEFDFAVGNDRYRIIRKRAKPKRRGGAGQTILEFQTSTGNGFRSITGDSVSQTQQKIIDTLHMDYPTFTNSAFLLQGHADEFTLKRPSERKQVLADILGLSLYDELEAQAKELAREQETEKAQLASTIQEIDNELAQKQAFDIEYTQAQSECSRLQKKTSEQESRLKSRRQEKESLENKKRQLFELQEQQKNTERDLERWDEQVRQHHSRLKEYEGLIAQRNSIITGYTEFAETKRLSDELEQKFRKSVALKERKHRLEMVIAQAGESLGSEHAVVRNKIMELESRAQKLVQLKSDHQQLQLQWRRLEETESALRHQRQNSLDLQVRVNYLESGSHQLNQEIKAIDEKLDLLLTEKDARCPLCETEIGAEGLELIELKYKAEKQQKVDSLVSNQAGLTQAQSELESLKKEILHLETTLNTGKASTESKAGILKRDIAEAEEARLNLKATGENLAEIEEKMARKDFAVSEQEALREIEDELTRLNYDERQHEPVRQRLSALEQYDTLNRRLEEAVRLLGQEQEFISSAGEATGELRRNLSANHLKNQTLTVELGVLPQLINELNQAESEYQSIITRQRQAQEMLWKVEAKLQRSAELEIKRKEKERILGLASREEKIYRDLAQAFGKKGIQALLIETALPEIEAEANELLGRMTDNRMHVKIETQRETKKGDVVETLDINIADELGTRNYEMFSGGEAFRINFAIRIALSKLLAHRAGAPLPTLVIDEGFGTQDSTGIEKLKEAINSIQDDFKMILVITHVEELRDAFPTRIDVTKTAQGSTISMN